MPLIDQLCDRMLEMRASDLHLLQGQKPKLRVHGHLQAIEDEPVLDKDRIKQMLEEICESWRWEKYLENMDIDFAYGLGDRGRFRVNYYYQMHGMGAVLRTIPTKIMTIEELNLPPVLKNFAKLRSGLVLMTGPTGSGKSTTLAAIIDYINTNESRYILTIEEPIEFVHPNKKSVFCQREVGKDTHSFASGLKTGARQNADVILVGEMRDYETISLALAAASMGSLVFGTLHTNSASKTVDRIIDVFPPDEQNKARTMLADTLRGVCSQMLLRSRDGTGRVAANEILLATQGLSSNIREGNNANIRNIIMAGKSNGMQLMDDAIEGFYKKGIISGEEGYLKANDKKRFEQFAPA
ncbi:PilT/PilU family type 4a pilus ATPase [bacterium]|nr:PilT/PilU family type 4a pilus ATPase [bacterium]